MLTIGCPQQVCASGKSTSTPSRRSSVTTAVPTSGNSASLMHVTISATRMGRSSQPRGSNRARSWVRATSARRSARPGPTTPAARACTSTLPRAVASTGPASTGRARNGRRSPGRGRRSARRRRRRARRRSCDPRGRPPARAPSRRPPRCSARCSARPATRPRGGATPCSAHQCPMRACMSARRQEQLVLHVDDRHRHVVRLGRAQHARRGRVSPQVRRVSLSSQVPITLVRNRIVPSTPPSLVKLASRASSVSTGASSSRPASAQVPRETYAASSVCMGTPTTADAVSWEPTATTGTTPADPLGDVGQQRLPSRRPGRRGRGTASGRGRAGPSARCPTRGW